MSRKRAVTLFASIFLCLVIFIIFILNNKIDKSVPEEKQEIVVTGMLQQSRNYLGLNRMVKKLKAEENITVDFQVIPDNQFDSLIQMKINAGEAPDIIDYNVPRVYGIINPIKYLVDLSDEEWTTRLNDPDMIKYSDGNIYSFPLQENSGIAGMIYNKDVFEKYNISIPKNEIEFEEVCYKLKEVGVDPILMCQDSWVPQMWMNYGYSQAFASDYALEKMSNSILSGESVLGDYPEMEQVIDYYLSMFKKGYVNEDYLTVNYDNMLNRFIRGEGAMILGYTGIMSAIEGKNRFINMGMFNPPFPYNENDVLVVPKFSIGFVALKDSENLEAVKKVFEAWSKPEYLQLWYEYNAGFPAFVDTYGGQVNEDVLLLYNSYNNSNKTVGESISYLNEIQPLNRSKFWLYYLEAPDQNISGEELLSKMQEDIDEYIDISKKN